MNGYIFQNTSVVGRGMTAGWKNEGAGEKSIGGEKKVINNITQDFMEIRYQNIIISTKLIGF